MRSRTGEAVVFRSALVPPHVRRTKTLDAALSWLYVKGVATGQMSEALAVLVGQDVQGRLGAPIRPVARGEATVSGVCVETDDETGLARHLSPLRLGGLLRPIEPLFWVE